MGPGTCIQTMESNKCSVMLSTSAPTGFPDSPLEGIAPICSIHAVRTLSYQHNRLVSCLKKCGIFWKGKQLPATSWPSLFRILSRSSLHLGRKSQELSSMFSWRNIRTYPSQTLALAKYPPNQLQPLNRSFLPFQTKLLVMQISGSRLNSKVDEIFWNMLMSYWTFLFKAPWNEFPYITNHLPISSSSRSSERSRRASGRKRWWDLTRRSSWDSCSIAPEWRHWVQPTGRRFIFTTKPNKWKKSRKGWYLVTWSIKCTCTHRRLGLPRETRNPLITNCCTGHQEFTHLPPP